VNNDIAKLLGDVMDSELPDEAKIATMIAAMVSSNYRQYAKLTQALLAQVTEERDQLRRELADVRMAVGRLFESPHMPTPDRVLYTVYFPPAYGERDPVPTSPKTALYRVVARSPRGQMVFRDLLREHVLNLLPEQDAGLFITSISVTPEAAK
jgi:hypothetical protein